jgi:uncharacterized damage-inducible protein DinB
MNRRNVIGSMVAAAAAVPFLKGQGPTGEIATWVKWWEQSKVYTLAVAEAMPADKYSYAPEKTGDGEGAQSFGNRMQHIVQAEGFYLGRFGKGAAPAAPTIAGAAPVAAPGGKGKGGPPADYSKAATIKYVNDVFDWAIATVKQLTPADLTRDVSGGKGAPMTGLDVLLNAMVHTGHTRGYLDMYLRNNGIKPPTYKVF